MTKVRTTIVVFQPVEEVLELLLPKHALAGSVRGVFVRAVPPGIEHKERRRAAPGESIVGFAAGGAYRGRVWCVLIVIERLDGGRVDTSCVGGPVVSDFVVVEDVDPGEILAGGRPVGGSVDLAVLRAVASNVDTGAPRDINVDEVTEEEHEGCV